MDNLHQSVAALPMVPGVYLFKNAEGTVLYVGKAVRLRDRVRSYFAKDLAESRGPGMVQMVRDAVMVEHQTAPSELEALLLEARLIRQYKPRYNIKLRDDKSFSLIRIDLSEEFPPIYISREKDLEELLAKKHRARAGVHRLSQKIDSQEFFGPYLSAAAVKQALKSIRSIWPFRDCSQTKYDTYAKLGHGCLFANLGLCDAPCVAKVTPEEYRKNIDQIRLFLRGERQQLIREVEKQMEDASANERYEQAARLRDRLQALVHLQEVAQTRRFLTNQQRSDSYTYNPEQDVLIEAYDISNNQGSYAVGSQIVGVVRGGKTQMIQTKEEARQRFYLDKTRYRKYKIKTVEGISDVDSLKEVLGRRFIRGKSSELRWKLPDMVLIDGGLGQLHAVQAVRKEKEVEVAIAAVAKGPTRRRVDLTGQDFGQFPQISSEAWQTIAELLREEAHRFAITYYRKLHRKSLVAP